MLSHFIEKHLSAKLPMISKALVAQLTASEHPTATVAPSMKCSADLWLIKHVSHTYGNLKMEKVALAKQQPTLKMCQFATAWSRSCTKIT